MRRVKVHLENIPGSPYSQSAQHDEAMLDRESHDDFDKRTWRKKCTVGRDGIVAVPAMAFKQCLDTAAYKVGYKVPNRRGATFKSFFASGVICDADVPIANGKPLKPEDAECVTISASSTGDRGGGKRVPRRFPVFDKWSGVASFTILDDLITRDVFEHHMRTAGMVVGIGRFRPEKGGTNGRFKAVKFDWEDIKL